MFDKLKALMAAKAAKEAKEIIGHGQYGTVRVDSPGAVRKEILGESPAAILNEANLQARAAELNIAPRINEVTVTPTGSNAGGTIAMQDLRTNYVPLGVDANNWAEPEWTGGEWALKQIEPNNQLNKTQQQMAQVDTHKQLAHLALNNVMLSDRHMENIFVNKLSNRPMQIDFGLATEIKTPSEQAGALAYHVGNGLAAAGLTDEAQLFSSLVNEVGEFNIMTNAYNNPAAALDMAKQGLSRLQKIKMPHIEQISAVQQNGLELARKKPLLMPTETPVFTRRNTWGEPIEKGYYGTPV